MEEDMRQPIHIYVDVCTTGCSALCQAEVYHAIFLQKVVEEGNLICKLEALNVAIKLWAPTLAGRQVMLHSDSAMAAAMFHAGKGRDSHIQACARKVWLACAVHDVKCTCKTHTHTHTHTHTVSF